MKTGQIVVGVSGTICQTLKVVDPTMSFEDVVNLMKKGEAFTSVGHGQDNGQVILFDAKLPLGYKAIAIVVAQEAGSDMEISFIDEDEDENDHPDWM